MGVMVIRAKVTDESVAEVETAAEAIFAAFDRAQPRASATPPARPTA